MIKKKRPKLWSKSTQIKHAQGLSLATKTRRKVVVTLPKSTTQQEPPK